jgi:tight adherence protein C
MELVGILAFFSAVTLVLGVASLRGGGSIKRRLAQAAGGTAAQLDRDKDVPTLTRGGPSMLERWLTPIANLVAGNDDLTETPVRRRLVEAGYRRPSAVAIFVGSRIALAAILPAFFLICSPMLGLDELQFMSLLAVSVVVGFFGPSHWVDRKRTARQNEIIRGLPDALDLMVVCVEAGLGSNASLDRISREFKRTNPILSAEFALVTLEIRAGKAGTEALRGLALRSGVAEVASLVAMLAQTERFGTNLADTLRVHADSLRVQRMQRAEEQAGKAPLKMMFPTLIIFAATLLVTLGPGMMQMMDFFAGRN